MYGSWDTKWDRIFCHYGPFFTLLPPHHHLPNDAENPNFEKKIMPEDIILLYIHFHLFGPFFSFQPLENLENQNFNNENNTWRYYHFTHLHHKWQSYDVWFLRYGVRQTKSFVILDQFLLFYPLWTQKIKILKKWKNTWKYYILHRYNINYNHIMYGS